MSISGCDWHAHLRNEQSHLQFHELPHFMMDSYEECRDPPRLYLLDKFDNAGAGACLKRYSDPSYFRRVWALSESDKGEHARKEKKTLKFKRKGSHLKNGEVHAAYKSGRSNRYFLLNGSSDFGQHTLDYCLASILHFTSPSTDAQSSSTENISTPDMRFNPEIAGESRPSGLKVRSSYVEEVSDTNPSVVPVVLEYDKLSDSKLHIKQSGACASVLHDEPNGDVADSNSQHDSLQGQSVDRSSSVTWDEKIEIVKAASPISCDDIIADKVQDSESLPVNSERPKMDHTKVEVSEQEDILFDIAKVPVSLSGVNHIDEVTSETDNYMDALNTLESEADTEAECQTKWEVNSVSNFNSQGMESGTGKILETAGKNPDSYDNESLNASNGLLNQDVSPKFSNLVSLNSLEYVQSPHMTDSASNPECSIANDLSENNYHDIMRRNGYGGIDNDLSPDSSIPSLQTRLVSEAPVETSMSQHSPYVDTAEMSSIKLWTNAGLFGVEPSKPPDLGVPNIASENTVSDSKSYTCDLASDTEKTNLHANGLASKSDTLDMPNESILNGFNLMKKMDETLSTSNSLVQSNLSGDHLFVRACNAAQQHDPSNCSPSFKAYLHGDRPIKQMSSCSPSFTSIYTLSDEPDLARNNGLAPKAELSATCNIESQCSEAGQSANTISSSFTGLAQRFLANTLRKASLTPPTGPMNAEGSKSEESYLLDNHQKAPTGVVSQDSNEENTKEKIGHGSLKSSLSSASHFSEQSSPPLEHMKISFHPMNGLESKLKLEFPNGNLHESIEDLMFPSFQLLPEPVVPLADSGSDSDDDTFCRSCPYSSEDLLSPRSYSNSELWEQDERNGCKDQGLFGDSHGISSSTTAISSSMRFEQLNHSSKDTVNGFGNLEAGNGTVSFGSGSIVDLPGVESVISLKNQQERRFVFLSDDPMISTLQAPDQQPPPPPLPPMQWRITKPSIASREDRDANTVACVNQFDALQDPKFAAQQQEQSAPKPPSISAMIAPDPKNNTQDQQKLNGHKESNHVANNKGLREELLNHIRDKHDQQKLNGHKGLENESASNKDLDERGELLHQIRNKTFNLRRPTTSKPTIVSQPTTNVGVAAILEKANAIRQAFVGNDEGGDDDNWSDG
ncbi:SCAR-like protein 2 [Cocos nucifera]|uniref:Protein SCAR n=1 Tax=Cocos nucifera TaxID=13894 RepID=A0A8K0MWE1_COCNU|nr:SCAR-like protein 2 [Cocos nucifera]